MANVLERLDDDLDIDGEPLYLDPDLKSHKYTLRCYYVPSTGDLLPDVSDPIHHLSGLLYLASRNTPTLYTELYSHVSTLADLNYEASYGEQTLAPIEYQS